jgi:uncharacterized protein YcaQ
VTRLTAAEARRLVLRHQRLERPRQLSSADIVEFIGSVGCIQYDPLDIVGRNADLVLHARVHDYRPEMLRRLLYETHELIDGWDKVTSIYQAVDFPAFHRFRRTSTTFRRGRNRDVEEAMEQIFTAIGRDGPASSADFDMGSTPEWFWGPAGLAKAALDALQHEGSLLVQRREGARKFFDIPSRVVGEALAVSPDPFSSETEYRDWRVLRRIGGLGIAWARKTSLWTALDNVKSSALKESIGRLLERGALVELEIEGDGPWFARTETLRLLDERSESAPRAAVIAPLDNLLWDRPILERLFGFTYVWEVYKPPAKREYGYYVLPVLYGDRFVARVEARRNDGDLRVVNWWWETDGVGITMQRAVRTAMRSLARCAGAKELRVDDGARDAGAAFLESAT